MRSRLLRAPARPASATSRSRRRRRRWPSRGSRRAASSVRTSRTRRQRPAEHAAEQGGGVVGVAALAVGAHEPALDVADPRPASARRSSRSNQASVATTPRVVRSASWQRLSRASGGSSGVLAEDRGGGLGGVGRRVAVPEAVDRRDERAAVVGREHRQVARAGLARERRARLAALERGGPGGSLRHARSARVALPHDQRDRRALARARSRCRTRRPAAARPAARARARRRSCSRPAARARCPRSRARRRRRRTSMPSRPSPSRTIAQQHLAAGRVGGDVARDLRDRRGEQRLVGAS